jgi:hypothetical protein
MDNLEPEQIGAAIRAFMAEKCPACGEKKERRKDAFCGECARYVPPELQEKLSEPFKFIKAFHPALDSIKNRREDGGGKHGGRPEDKPTRH